jgi:hypothetical protein
MTNMALSPLLLSLLALTAPQGSPRSLAAYDAAPLGVVRFEWRRMQTLPPIFSRGLYRADAGLVPPGAGLPQPLTGDSSTSARLGRRRSPSELNPPMIYEPAPAVRERDIYWYSVKVRNLAPLPIQTVVWGYVFRDPGSGVVQGVVQIRNNTTIKPGKSKTLEGYTQRPPSNVATVATLKSKKHEGESIVIVAVVFSDHTVWHPATVSQ